MPARLVELADYAGVEFRGDADCLIHSVNTLSDANAGDISFLSNSKYQSQLTASQASAVIVDYQVAETCNNRNLLISKNPYLTFAKVATWFESREHANLPNGIHPSAVVSATATIGDNCFIGPQVVIGEGAVIGDNCRIGAGSVVGNSCQLGTSTCLHANVTLYESVSIGDRCILHSGAVIGSDGFGFANDQGTWFKVPQRGSVKIGDDVEIGANTAIDRGAINDTVIENGAKLDNLIQVAHNVRIGKNSAIAANTGISGSTVIGDNVTIAGGVGLVGHIEVGDGAHLAGMALVSKSVPEKAVISGAMPGIEHGKWAKSMVRFRQLDDMAKKIKQLEKQLMALSGNPTD